MSSEDERRREPRLPGVMRVVLRGEDGAPDRVLTTADLSKNGALLLNVGPRADGTIPDPEQNMLREIGAWLQVNGESIFDVAQRVRAPLLALEKAAIEGNVLIVGHQVVNMAMTLVISRRSEVDSVIFIPQNNDEVDAWDIERGERIEKFTVNPD